MKLVAKSLVQGTATGKALYSNVPLSFWGGVDPETGEVIDRHHPLSGEFIHDRILLLPGTRGSCSGSLVLIELLVNGKAPAAIIFRDAEEIATTGVMVAKTLLEISIPVLRVAADDYKRLTGRQYASIINDELQLADSPLPFDHALSPPNSSTNTIHLSEEELAILHGAHSPAAAKAMQILLQYAHLQDAPSLTPVSSAHIDACIYTGPASLLIAKTFLTNGARVAVPTTLNSISIDQMRWRELSIDSALASEANKLANAYVAMGATNSFTCAPYLLSTKPGIGESIGWAESNAVVFANSVLGARTQKYPDLIDVCIALTGRAPLAGAQTEDGRVPRIAVTVDLYRERVEELEDALWPVLGYAAGKVSGGLIPLILGLEGVQPRPTISDLKAFGAAFATTASAAMFHIAGVTPEAHLHLRSATVLKQVTLSDEDCLSALKELTTATDETVGLVSLGNPHFSLEEFVALSGLCAGRRKSNTVQMIITTNREIYAQACAAGYTSAIEAFGAEILTDTCWCMIPESIIGPSVKNLFTNSAKYAHYAPGIVHRGVHFGSLRESVLAAERGVIRFDGR